MHARTHTHTYTHVHTATSKARSHRALQIEGPPSIPLPYSPFSTCSRPCSSFCSSCCSFVLQLPSGWHFTTNELKDERDRRRIRAGVMQTQGTYKKSKKYIYINKQERHVCIVNRSLAYLYRLH